MKTHISLYFLLLVLITGCGNNAALDQSSAADLVVNYLKSNPVYETEKIELGELKFKSNSDKEELAKFKELADKGYVELQLKQQKKKFLSKDSNYVYLITLTDKSKPYIIKQEQNKATLKVMEYALDDDKPATLDKSGNKTAKVTVMLKKVQNAFTLFYNDKNNSSNFITKTYKLKYNKEAGWIVAGN
ncbi:hypothetical protein [Pedobacter nyackensis]|uniref:hypothetical protein n=1 Tax=Pedobacter nyackensis TaxID=475255 RepID=UPI0029303E62|nr:hypothetical protein [Pedobacter nyackensis]